ncbi:MAG: hypothetical protein ACJAZX_000206 [Rickettsiales bacterium]|jgi:hypothetical protein
MWRIINLASRTLFGVFMLTSLSSCGFHTIYSDNKISSKSKAYNEELASIKVEISRSKLNQDLKNNLEDILNPNNIQESPKYSINIILNKSITPTFINSFGSSGRNKVTLDANYRLKDLITGLIIATGNATANDDFDVEDKRFANYITEQSIASNLTLIIAQNIRNLLINDIVNNYKVRELLIDENSK